MQLKQLINEISEYSDAEFNINKFLHPSIYVHQDYYKLLKSADANKLANFLWNNCNLEILEKYIQITKSSILNFAKYLIKHNV